MIASPTTNPLLMRSTPTMAILAVVCILLSSCAIVEEAYQLPDGTYAYRPIWRSRGFMRDFARTKTHRQTAVVPWAIIDMPDGTFITGSNVIVTTEDSEAVTTKSTTPDTLNAMNEIAGTAVGAFDKIKP